jgi:hypothetical protein
VGEFWKSLAGVVVGGLIAIATAYFSAQWAADNQRKQFLFERAQVFSEFLALQYLPRTGDVPQECQARLEECRRLRQSAVQVYLFLPTVAQNELVKSYGPDAVAAVAPDKTRVLPPEATAFNNALKATRQWLTGEKEENFNFILPCANWAVEEKQCKKQP